MSKKFEYPIERFLYDDDYTNEDLKILELDSNELQNIVDQEKLKEDENKEEEKKDNENEAEKQQEEKEDEIISNKDTVE